MRTAGARKDELITEGKKKMIRHLLGNDWTARQSVALACRILFMHGHDSGLAGQITARASESGTYYTQRFGLGFDEVTETNLLVVDEDLTVLSGSGMANPANRFHSWIYGRRPDVRCIVHTHPSYVSALSLLEQPLKVAHMDSCMLHGEVAFLEKWPGVPVGNDEGKLISEVLGDKRAVLLAHHGLVVAARSVEEACVLALQIERTARLQLLAQAAGEIRDLDEALAREAHDWLLHPKKSVATFQYYARRVLRSLSPRDALMAR
ncbi:aldolase [Paraburkholderia aspalathi]|uniref:aldolase n=1 Tax=Paraburkholderia aspalathi TaxID=1324617 RepID=UPI0038BE0FE4